MKTIILLLLVNIMAFSDVFVLDDKKIEKASLSHVTTTYIDESCKKELHQVKTLDEFKKIKQNNFKAKAHHIWSKFSIYNSTKSEKEVYLENSKAGVDIIDIYIFRDNVYFKKFELGDLREKKDRELQTRKSAFVLKLDPIIKYDFYAMHKSYSSISTLWHLQSRQSFENIRSIENLTWGVISGVIITLCLYNLMLFFVTKELAFLSYVFMALSLLIYQLNVNGVFYQFLDNVNLHYLSNVNWFVGFLSLVFSMLFPIQFFKPKKSSFTFKLLVVMLFVYVTITTVYGFAFWYPELRYLTKYSDIAALMLIPTIIFTSLWALKKRLTGAMFYLFGQVTYLSVVIYVFMTMIGYLETFDYVWILLPLGITFDAVFLLLALFVKLKDIDKQKRTNEELIISQARFTTMGRTVANMTHQWKTPISKLGSEIFLLEATYKLDKDNFDEVSKQTLTKMKESISYLNNTINDIYNFYSNPTSKETFNFKTELDSLLRLLSDEIKLNNITITKEIDASQSYHSYRGSFLNVMMIILENSIYQLKRFVKEDRHIKISLKNDNKSVKISVEDNGGGVNNKDLEKLFHMDFSTKNNKGSGIGLVLAKKLTQERLEGEIEVNNSKNGAVFSIVLP